MQVDTSSINPVGTHQANPFLDPRYPVWNMGKGIPAEKFLLLVKRAMIRTDRIDQARCQGIPKRLLIPFVPPSWSQVILHALYSNALRRSFVQKKLWQDALHGQLHAAPLGV